MGLLDQVMGGVLGSSQRGNDQASPMTAILKALLSQQGGGSGGLGGLLGSLSGGDTMNANSDPGGLGGLIDRFTNAGHGDIADSWVGTGQNRPVAPHQVEEVLGGTTLDDLSRQTGLSRDEILSQLSAHLPNAVDRLTPKGQRPSANEMKHW